MTGWLNKNNNKSCSTWDLGSPGGSVAKKLPADAEGGVRSLGQEDLLDKEMETHPSILAQDSHGQRNLVGYSPWDAQIAGYNLAPKQQMRDLVPRLGIELRSPALREWSLSHWITREIPVLSFLLLLNLNFDL